MERKPHHSSSGYLVIWLVLLVLTGAAVTIAGLDLGQVSILGTILCAWLMGTLVVLFFMGIRYINRIFKIMLAAAVLLLAAIMILTLKDLSFPGFKLLPLSPYLVFFFLLLHLPYMGMVLGFSLLSAAFNKWKPDLAKDFMNLVSGKPMTWITLGILPPGALILLYKIPFPNTPAHIHLYLVRLLGILLLGLILLALFRRSAHILAGAVGALLVLVYCFLLVNLSALLIFPEKWLFLKAPLPYPLFSITPLIHFAGFLCLSIIMTGAAIVFFFCQWPEKRLQRGYGLVLVGSLLLPVIIFWDIYTLPGYALSLSVLVLAGLIIIVLFLLSISAYFMIPGSGTPTRLWGVTSFLLTLVLFGLVIGKDRTLHANASLETSAVLKDDAQKARSRILAKRQELYAQTMVIDAALGEKIYNDRCSVCHSFEQRILGPPFNQVLPKYAGKQEELVAFIRNPRKVDPQYPAMPNPNLGPIEIKAVVKFLLEKGANRD